MMCPWMLVSVVAPSLATSPSHAALPKATYKHNACASLWAAMCSHSRRRVLSPRNRLAILNLPNACPCAAICDDMRG
eukprot:3799363-Pyramimonas_sp.AAC.1